ncbi:MAG: glycosyltransferase family 39 protein [Caldilinea sp.]|nr:glycosyltransferase family 39 protein [Caldilinea sp.]MDW8440985.1 hypothetical protein [Caldilineaceae bacterium]
MSRRRMNALATLLVAAHFALALNYSIWNPAGEAPDEADHWAYVVYLARERSLPEGPKVTQSKHPPLAHIGAAALASLAAPSFDFLRANPDVQLQPGENWSPNFFIHTRREAWPWSGSVLAFHLARLWSVLMSTATVAAVYALAKVTWPRQPGLALTAMGATAFLPELAFLGGAVSNDSTAAFFGTLSLWGALVIFRAGAANAHRRLHRALGGTAPALGLGLLTKASTVALWPAVAMAIFVGALCARFGRRAMGGWRAALRSALLTWRRWLRYGAFVFLPALVIASPWLWRNWRLYGDPTGMALVRQTVDLRTTPWTWEDTTWLLKGWFLSFWGKFGGAGHIPMADWVYALLAALTALGLLGYLRGWRARTSDEHVALAVLATALFSTAFGVWRYSMVALGTDQGRLLFPAIGAIVVLWVEGLQRWVFFRRTLAAAALLALLAGLSVYGLVGVILPAMAPPKPAVLTQRLQQAEPFDFGELALVDWALGEEIVLYWRSNRAPTQDWRTTLRVVAEDGSLAWEWRRSPGYGRWSTDHWPEGVVVEDRYVIRWPQWAGPGRYLVEVGLQVYDGEYATPQQAGQAAGAPFAPLGWMVR